MCNITAAENNSAPTNYKKSIILWLWRRRGGRSDVALLVQTYGRVGKMSCESFPHSKNEKKINYSLKRYMCTKNTKSMLF